MPLFETTWRAEQHYLSTNHLECIYIYIYMYLYIFNKKQLIQQLAQIVSLVPAGVRTPVPLVIHSHIHTLTLPLELVSSGT